MVSYYLSKGFVVLDYKSDTLKNVPDKLKEQIYIIDKHTKYCEINFNISIQPYLVNNLKNIFLNSDYLDTFYTTFYNDKGTVFEHLFKEFTKHSVNKISHPALLK